MEDKKKRKMYRGQWGSGYTASNLAKLAGVSPYTMKANLYALRDSFEKKGKSVEDLHLGELIHQIWLKRELRFFNKVTR